MHSWGDGFQYFAEVDQAAFEIGEFCRTWGRISITQTKEKWGTVRVYGSFGCEDLHGLIFPGFVYIRGPYRLMTFPFFTLFRPLVISWQKFIYRTAYARAIKKYPFIKEEILCCADWREFLKGL